MSATLADVAGKLAGRLPLDDADVSALAATTDLIALGMMAEQVRAERHADRVTFVRVVDVPLDGHGAPEIGPTIDAGEVRLSGPLAGFDRALDRLRAVVAAARSVPVTGFSLADLYTLAEGDPGRLRDLLARLRDAGLDAIAEVPVDRIGADALEAVARAGLAAPRFTVDVFDAAHRLAAIRGAAALQRASGAARAFAPLGRAADPLLPSTGYDDVKQVALARLLVDNIDSVQVDWSASGPKLAQVALTFGADDVDRVSPEGPGEAGRRRSPLEEIRRNIRAASLIPVERNGRFETITP